MGRMISRRLAAPLLILALLGGSAPLTHSGGPVQAAGTQAVTVSMGYIPNVQFTPFYVADARGYYKAAGLTVHFDYTLSTDVIKVVGSGSVAFGDAEADQVIAGAGRGLSVVSVLAQYQRFPVVIFALKSSHIRSFSDLKGKTIGIPGLYGASYTGLLAALAAAHLTTHDVKIEAIGYAQVAAVARHRVDAAVGYAMNEPIQLGLQGYPATVLPIAQQADLAGPGIVTSQALITHNPDLVSRFVSASLHGLRDTIANPTASFALARRYMPSLSGSQLTYQMAVLREAIRYWTPFHTRALGCNNPAQWTATAAILLSQHQITSKPRVGGMYSNRFIPKC
ncbi:MAG TPA: ABC transporter substrate-binding protein [Chloroflexota bacterium]|nr:ABC transporter substrate-binding protein [Chloroflexota bacterium]